MLLDIKSHASTMHLLATMTETIKFSEREIILQSVEKSDCVYMVFTGSLEVSSAKKASANADIHVIKVPPGSWFDHKSLASYRAANYIVTSVTACELGTVKISSLEAVKDQDEGIRIILTRIKGGVADSGNQGSTVSTGY